MIQFRLKPDGQLHKTLVFQPTQEAAERQLKMALDFDAPEVEVVKTVEVFDGPCE
jgi:hypothetical protein